MNEFLRELLKSRAAEAALLHLYHYGETYGRAIAKDMGVSQMPVQKQLDRLESCGLLVSKALGTTRNYTWNPASPFVKPVKELVAVVYESLSPEERERLFATRRRPRRKGKPVLGSPPPDVLPEIVVLAHFGWIYGDLTERCFLKIANSSSSKPALVTHIDYVGTGETQPLLDARLPHSLKGAGLMEVHVPVKELPEAKSADMLTRFRVTDSVGRKFWSVPNHDVSPAGRIGSA